MRSTQPPLLRLAVAIHAQLTARRPTARLTELPASNLRRCEELVRQIRRTELRGWSLAGDVLRSDLRFIVRSLQTELGELAQQLAAAGAVTGITRMSDILEDLAALHSEFVDLTYDRRGHWLSVTTEPLVLEDRFLGPFEIRLDWTRLPSEPSYRIIALEPHPAASREGVTHPHVLDEILCEGEGRVAIRQALAQGRLLDFYTLVAQLLRTYNRDSSFVELDRWDGVSCADCGASVDDEEGYACEACGGTVCGGCEVTCSDCGNSYCSGCVTGCSVCDDSCCRGCLRRCDGCRERVCSGCLNENLRCSNCHEEQERLETTDTPPEIPHSPLYADSLGQTPVPA